MDFLEFVTNYEQEYALKCFKIWFANLTNFWDNPQFLHTQCLLGRAL